MLNSVTAIKRATKQPPTQYPSQYTRNGIVLHIASISALGEVFNPFSSINHLLAIEIMSSNAIQEREGFTS